MRDYTLNTIHQYFDDCCAGLSHLQNVNADGLTLGEAREIMRGVDASVRLIGKRLEYVEFLQGDHKVTLK